MVGCSHDALTTVVQWVDLGRLLVTVAGRVHGWVTTLLLQDHLVDYES